MPATPTAPADARHTPMTFNVVHPAQRKRVTGDAFENGDRVGLFVHATDALLEIGGNLANNEPLTCGGDVWLDIMNEGVTTATGVLNIVAGVAFLLMPAVSSLAAVYVVGAYLIVGGITLLVEGASMRPLQR